ncbi:MAG: hypothetical protein J5626_08350 [Lachnospiraceae bacterium]|nr:hypothetical protein [Lachnospiraceae bacterium]
MRLKKIFCVAASAVLSVAILSACGKKVPGPVSVSERVTESVSSVTEDKEEVSVSEKELEEEFPEVSFTSWRDFYAELYRMTRDALLEKGEITEDEKLFYSGNSDFDKDEEYGQIDSINAWDSEMPFITFDDKGLKNVFVVELSEATGGNIVTIKSFDVSNLDEYSKAPKDDEYRNAVPDSFEVLMTTRLCHLRSDSLDSVREFVNKVTEDGALSRNSRVIDYIYEKSGDKEMFKDPIKLAKFFFPYLKDIELQSIKDDVEHELVTYTEGEKDQVIRFSSFKRLSGGERVYYPEKWWNWNLETVKHKHGILDNVTAELLDKAYEDHPAWDDAGLSPYYIAAETEDKSAVLYGLFDAEPYPGAVLRTGDGIYPLYTVNDLEWGTELWANDFDGDGEKEYAFTACAGHGTGFFQGELYIVDPGEKNVLSRFNNFDDMFNSVGSAYDMVRYEYDEESGRLTYWLEEDGARKCEGSLDIDKEYWKMWGDDATFGELVFGDIFTITYENGVLGFSIGGGLTPKGSYAPSFNYSVNILGDFVYKNGIITYDNLRFETHVEDWR